MLISQGKVIQLAANRKINEDQILNAEIEAAEFKYIRGSLKEDLYESIIDSPFSTDPDFTTGIVGFADLLRTYKTNTLSCQKAGGAIKQISAITMIAESVFTSAGHGLITDDIIYITGEALDTSDLEIKEMNDKLLYNELKVTKLDNDTFKLTSNLVNDYLKKPLAYYVLYLAVNRIYIDLSDRGAKHLGAENTTNIDSKARDNYKQTLIDTADILMGKALDYIDEQEYTDYEGQEGDEDKYTGPGYGSIRPKRVTHF